MKEYLACEYSSVYGASIVNVRRLTDEEKGKYAEEYRETAFSLTPNSPDIRLDFIKWQDLMDVLGNRESDGQFIAVPGLVYIITEQEQKKLLDINDAKKSEKENREKNEKIERYKEIIRKCEAQGKLYTPEEAKRRTKQYNDVVNEGGSGYVPHYYTTREYEIAKSELEKLNIDN